MKVSNLRFSDDFLVDWASKQNNLEDVLFVTSDRALEKRLISVGAKSVMKTGVWFSLTKRIIGENKVSKIIQIN